MRPLLLNRLVRQPRLVLLVVLLAGWLLSALLGALPATTPQAQAGHGQGKPRVLEAPIEGTIDPVSKQFVERVLRRAERGGYDAVVFTMDTPGGLSTSMDDIIKAILDADDLPVIVHVAPSGARAASAGAFITMASDYAAMAPGTRIGSATPIQSGGQDIGKDLRKKVVNDAVSQIRGLAKEHDRDPDAAEDMVRDAENYESDDALDKNLVELVAESLTEVLDEAHGTTAPTKDIPIHTEDARVTHMDVPFQLRFLKLLIDPNILFLLFSAGTLGLAFEITHPGAIAPGVIGAICIVVALFGFQVLPINVAGVALILFAFVLFVAEALVVSHGVLGIGGAVSLVIGGLLLFDNDSPYSISLPLLILVALMFAAFFGLLVHKALEARKRQPVTGPEELVGAHATVRKALSPKGSVFLHGEIWRAESDGGEAIAEGERVVVETVDGLTLHVRPAGPAHPDPPSET